MKKIALFAMLSLFLYSCKKKTDDAVVKTSNNFKTYTSMEEVFSNTELQPRVVFLNTERDTSVYGNSGTRYTFRKNSMMYASGDTVAGIVQVNLTEYLRKGDMVFSRVLPLSGGSILSSGGEFSISVTKSGQEVFLRADSVVGVDVPQGGSKDTVMAMFRGYADNSVAASKINWTAAAPTTGGFLASATYHADTQHVIIDSFKLWNCDHFAGITNKQSFQVSIIANNKPITSGSGIYTYALFTGQNALLPLSGEPEYKIDGLPKQPMRFVSFGLVDGHFYGGVTDKITPVTGNTYTVTLSEVEPEDMKGQINGLY